eukprot:6988473-Pyramimonas_sp.AAC.1
MNETDTQKRLAAANQLWYRVYRNLPRLGLSAVVKAKVCRATVVACLLCGSEVRRLLGQAAGQ